VNANRLRHDVARRLAEREPLPVGVYPPGLARLSERADELDLTPLVRAVHGERGDGMAGAAVVHLGCATGHLLETLRGEGAAVEGLERNPALAAAARERLGEVVRPGGPEELTPASADVLLCIDCLGRTHDPAAALARMKQALRPEGRLVLCEPIFDDPAAPLNFPAALLARVMYNYHFSRGGIETLSHVAQFVNIRDHGSWNDWPILILK
jgi:SAM-dependent methyltransferase